MGHEAKIPGNICDVTDEIEAAITLGRHIRVELEDGSHKMGMPRDIYSENHEDFLNLEGHLPIPLTKITHVKKL